MNYKSSNKSSILVTGSTGFLGSVIFHELKKKYSVIGLARSRGEILVDLSTNVPDFFNYQFQSVIHCAGLAHINDVDKSTFEKANVQGSLNLLQALENQTLGSMVFISSVSVYGLDSGYMIDETQEARPSTDYGMSKLKAEEIIKTWCRGKNIPLLILRLPLLTGKNPPGNLASMYRAINRGLYFAVNSKPVRKSIVATRDIARWLPSVLGEEGTFHLCDGVHPSITQVEQRLSAICGKRIRKVPYGLLELSSRLGDFMPAFPLNTSRFKKLNSELTFSDNKARQMLGWNPSPALDALEFS